MIDYQLLGALIGSAWRKENPTQLHPIMVQGMYRAIGNQTGFNKHPGFNIALHFTMQGRCFACGSSSEVGRDGRGVYVCRMCIEGQGQ